MSNWYYVRNGQRSDPVTIESLRQLAASGELQPADLVWTDGMAQWQPAAQTPEIFPAGVMPPPPLPLAPIGYASPPPYAGPAGGLGGDPGVRWLLPVGRSGWAIAAGYLGLFSVIFFPAPLALICGIIAIRDIRRNPQRHGMGRAIFGVIMGAIFSIALVFVVIAMTTSRSGRY